MHLDDIIVFPFTVDAHLRQVAGVLDLLKKAVLSVKLKKCFFTRRSLDYLGHVIRPSKLSIEFKTCHDVQHMRTPPN